MSRTACAWGWNYRTLREWCPSVREAEWKITWALKSDRHHFLFIENTLESETGFSDVYKQRSRKWELGAGSSIYIILFRTSCLFHYTPVPSQKKRKRQVPVLWSSYSNRWDGTNTWRNSRKTKDNPTREQYRTKYNQNLTGKERGSKWSDCQKGKVSERRILSKVFRLRTSTIIFIVTS